jgi:hypothetical protein
MNALFRAKAHAQLHAYLLKYLPVITRFSIRSLIVQLIK